METALDLVVDNKTDEAFDLALSKIKEKLKKGENLSEEEIGIVTLRNFYLMLKRSYLLGIHNEKAFALEKRIIDNNFIALLVFSLN